MTVQGPTGFQIPPRVTIDGLMADGQSPDSAQVPGDLLGTPFLLQQLFDSFPLPGRKLAVTPRPITAGNAWTESFIGTLKLEMLQDGCFENAADARLEIFDYIEGYYNTHRKHSSIGYKTPNQFEAHIHSTN
jgi:hypothetical protein